MALCAWPATSVADPSGIGKRSPRASVASAPGLLIGGGASVQPAMSNVGAAHLLALSVRDVEAPASFAALVICPRCWSRARTQDAFTCPRCGETKRTRPEHGVCRPCYERAHIGVSTCEVCGQTRRMVVDGSGVCHSCHSLEAARRKGIQPARVAEAREAAEARLTQALAPLRRPWVRDFLSTAYQRRAAATRLNFLRTLVRFDRFLREETDVGEGQWSLVTRDVVEAHLAERGRFQLQRAKVFFAWLLSRKHTREAIARSLPNSSRPLKLRLLSDDQVASLYRNWTEGVGDAAASLVGLLALVHCLRNTEIRLLRVTDVLTADQLRIGRRVVQLAPPVATAMARYLTWRSTSYDGPSSYLLVNLQSRLHDRPVSPGWFAANLLPFPVANLRQTAIHRLITASGCDGLQLAAYAALSLDSVGVYMRAFGAPDPWPPSAAR